MSLPIYQTTEDSVQQSLSLLQTSWASKLNPILANPVSNGLLLKNVSLVNGTNAVNHKLGRKLQGWIVTRKRANAELHDEQDSNQNPSLTLTLVSDADVIVDLYVF